jgi:hypothetical protein
LNITTKRLRELIKEELIKEHGDAPFRTGLSAGGWEGMADPRSGTDLEAFPETEPERIGDMLAAAMEGGIRDVLQTEFGTEKGMEMFDRYLAEVDEDILNIAMRMRDHALELSGTPEGYVGEEEES